MSLTNRRYASAAVISDHHFNNQAETTEGIASSRRPKLRELIDCKILNPLKIRVNFDLPLCLIAEIFAAAVRDERIKDEWYCGHEISPTNPDCMAHALYECVNSPNKVASVAEYCVDSRCGKVPPVTKSEVDADKFSAAAAPVFGDFSAACFIMSMMDINTRTKRFTTIRKNILSPLTRSMSFAERARTTGSIQPFENFMDLNDTSSCNTISFRIS
ncbi:hypothetical protein Fcan01_28356 [Folsomia candida]|uniref:Uncharacterized protein n=1 Tax=Folsomia candida TaxID=158441 RepID=A0A226CVT4_FOLCA|nr:hypothetical protein Fcan01_28356 [Folsomia candida]